MTYIEIVNLIFQIITGIISALTLHYFIFLIVGIFARKKFPKAKVQHNYGVVISARNEDKVIGNLIKSIQKQKYPQEKIHIFVIAHNCTDRTAEIARELGATVYEYNNENEKTKGYALKYLFDQIQKDYGIETYEGYFMFDADNVLKYNYIEKMNDAFEYYGCKNVITSFRNTKNLGTNAISASYGLLFLSGCIFEGRARTIFGCSTRVQGTGHLMNSSALKDGWPYVTLTEDWEFSADQILHGNKIYYCDEAEFFDEQPTSFKIMLRQRIRWAKGHLIVCATRAKDLFKNIFRKQKADEPKINRGSSYDILTNILPFYIISVCLYVLQFVLLAIAPLFGPVDVGAYWLGWLKSTGISLATAYGAGMLSAIIIFILGNKRLQKLNFWTGLSAVLFWPIFVALNIVTDFVALFSKNVGWKTIPHKDTTNFEMVNKEHVEKEENKVEIKTEK